MPATLVLPTKGFAVGSPRTASPALTVGQVARSARVMVRGDTIADRAAELSRQEAMIIRQRGLPMTIPVTMAAPIRTTMTTAAISRCLLGRRFRRARPWSARGRMITWGQGQSRGRRHPHPSQNFAAGRFSFPHRGHSIAAPPASRQLSVPKSAPTLAPREAGGQPHWVGWRLATLMASNTNEEPPRLLTEEVGMPWRETAPMAERMRFVTDWERDLYSDGTIVDSIGHPVASPFSGPTRRARPSITGGTAPGAAALGRP